MLHSGVGVRAELEIPMQGKIIKRFFLEGENNKFLKTHLIKINK
jgi:hypothetical protein